MMDAIVMVFTLNTAEVVGTLGSLSPAERIDNAK